LMTAGDVTVVDVTGAIGLSDIICLKM